MIPIATSFALMGKRPGCADGFDLRASWCECRINALREASDGSRDWRNCAGRSWAD